MNKFMDKLRTFWQKTEPVRRTIAKIFSVIWKILRGIGIWIYRLRSILLSIPVAVAAVLIAEQNMTRLPEQVGINLLVTGDYQYLITREVAIMGPLAVTVLCLLLVLCSRRVMYPWLISIFSLVLPYLIWITNIFPA